MADSSNVLKRYLDAGIAFTQMTQSRAEAIVKDLVRAGEVQTEQAQSQVAELLTRSRENTERLLDQVRKEVRDSVKNLGLATQTDIARLERKLNSLSDSGTAQKASASSKKGSGTAKRASGAAKKASRSTKKASGTAKKASGTAKKTSGTAKKTSGTAKKTSGRAKKAASRG